MGVLDDYKYNVSSGNTYSGSSVASQHVASFDETAASAVKEPTTFSDFEYDKTQGGVISCFEKIQNKINDIRSDVGTLQDKFTHAVDMYEKFSNLSDTMNGIISRMNASIDTMTERSKDFVKTAQQEVEEQVKTDTSYLGSLRELNIYLGHISEADAGSTSSGFTNAQSMLNNPNIPDNVKDQIRGSVPSNGTSTSSGFVSNQQTLSDTEKAAIADNVIRGDYGNAPDRKAALEAQGISYDDIQSIVNQKMNGTYVEPTTSTTSPTSSGFVNAQAMLDNPNIPDNVKDQIRKSGASGNTTAQKLYDSLPDGAAKTAIANSGMVNTAPSTQSGFITNASAGTSNAMAGDSRYSAPQGNAMAGDPRYYQSDLRDRADAGYDVAKLNQQNNSGTSRPASTGTVTASTPTSSALQGDWRYKSDTSSTSPDPYRQDGGAEVAKLLERDQAEKNKASTQAGYVTQTPQSTYDVDSGTSREVTVNGKTYNNVMDFINDTKNGVPPINTNSSNPVKPIGFQ